MFFKVSEPVTAVTDARSARLEAASMTRSPPIVLHVAKVAIDASEERTEPRQSTPHVRPEV
jgi:hypothetical protein